MTKPQLDLRCQIGFSDTPASDISAVTWTDVTSYLRLQDGVSLYRGRQDETSTVGAGNASFTLNNRDGRFTPGNTAGAYYPNVKIRRPVRFSRCQYDAETILSQATLWLDAQFSTSSQTVPNLGTGGTALNGTLGSTSGSDSNDPQWLPYAGTNYVYLPGVANNYLSVPDAAALDITGDIDLRARLALDDWTPAATARLVTKWQTTGQFSYSFYIGTAGNLAFQATTDGTTGTLIAGASTIAVSFTDGQAGWIRVTRASASGEIKFYTAADSATEPSSWTQLGTTVTTTTGAMWSGTSEVSIGARTAGTLEPVAGKFYRAQVLNGIGGTKVLDVDTSVVTGSSTTFTATTGQTVTVNASTSGRKTTNVVGNCWLRGTDDFTECPSAAGINFDASTSFSVMWAGREWATPTSGGALVAKRTTGQGYALTQTTTTHGATFTISDGANTASATSPASSAGATRVYTAVVDRSAQTLTVYCDGVAGTPVSTSAVGSLANAEVLRIGRLSGASTSYSDAEDFAVAVVGSALTAGQIQTISDYYSTRTYNSAFTAPYMPIWTGYVEQWGNGWNQGVQPVVRVQASDLMARLANRTMDALTTEEQLYDSPALLYPLDDSTGATAAGSSTATATATMPVTQAGSGGTATFGTAGLLGADTTQGVLVLTRVDSTNGKYLTQTYNPLPALAGVAGATVECYVYLPVSVTGAQRVIELARYASFDLLAIDLTTNAPSATITIGGTTVTTAAGSAINDGAWHHVAAWYDGATVKCYVDGTAVASSAAVLGAFTGSILTIGGANNGTSLANAWLSGAAAYGSALSSTRMTAHAAARNGALSESSLARFNRIARLAIGSWTASASTYAPSATMCAQPFVGQAAASLLYAVQDAEIAPVYITAAGTVAWTSRSQRTSAAVTVAVPLTTVDSSTGFTTSNQLVLNSATYSRPNGASVTVSDATSVAAYGKVSESKTIYYDTDAQVTSAANYAVNSRKDPQIRTGALTIDLVTADAVASSTSLLALDIGSVLEVTSVPLGSITTVDVFVEGINDAITPDSWKRTWNTSPLRVGGQTWVLGSPIYSVLGSTTTLGA